LEVADLRGLPRDAFWVYLDNRGWPHPFDEGGRRRTYQDVPKRISALVDDPFRILAGELRRSGGFAKDTMSYSEFLWADFLRRRIMRPANASRMRRFWCVRPGLLFCWPAVRGWVRVEPDCTARAARLFIRVRSGHRGEAVAAYRR
jgi:hypothetical protein